MGLLPQSMGCKEMNHFSQTNTAVKKKKLWMHADDKLHNQRCRDSSKLQTNFKLVTVTKATSRNRKISENSKWKFNNNTYNWDAIPLALFKRRTSMLHLRFPAWTNLHFKPLYPFNQSLCMPSQPLQNFQAKSQTEAHKAIFDYTLAPGETLSNSSASCGEGPGDSQLLNWRPEFFSTCSEESRLWS